MEPAQNSKPIAASGAFAEERIATNKRARGEAERLQSMALRLVERREAMPSGWPEGASDWPALKPELLEHAQISISRFNVLLTQSIVVRPVLVLLKFDLRFRLLQRQTISNCLAHSIAQILEELAW